MLVTNLGLEDVIDHGTSSGLQQGVATFDAVANTGTLTGRIAPLLSGTGGKLLELLLLDSGLGAVAADVIFSIDPVTPYGGITNIEVSDGSGGTLGSGSMVLSGNTMHPFTLTLTDTLLTLSIGTMTLTATQTSTAQVLDEAVLKLVTDPPLGRGFNCGSLTLFGHTP